tara:strand:- start:1237 stop:1521 length:285 start_codon:yes stop_codon:yes gene_type:complete
MNMRKTLFELFGIDCFKNKTRTIVTVLVFVSVYGVAYMLGVDNRAWQVANGYSPTTLDLPYWAQITIYYAMDFIIASLIGILLFFMTMAACDWH